MAYLSATKKIRSIEINSESAPFQLSFVKLIHLLTIYVGDNNIGRTSNPIWYMRVWRHQLDRITRQIDWLISSQVLSG